MQAVASSDSRQAGRLPSSPSDSRPPAALPPWGPQQPHLCNGRGAFVPQAGVWETMQMRLKTLIRLRGREGEQLSGYADLGC